RHRRGALIPKAHAESQFPAQLPVVLNKHRRHHGLVRIGIVDHEVAASRQPVQERGQTLSDWRRRRVVQRAACPRGIEGETARGIPEVELVPPVYTIGEAVTESVSSNDGRHVGGSLVYIGGR